MKLSLDDLIIGQVKITGHYRMDRFFEWKRTVPPFTNQKGQSPVITRSKGTVPSDCPIKRDSPQRLPDQKGQSPVIVLQEGMTPKHRFFAWKISKSGASCEKRASGAPRLRWKSESEKIFRILCGEKTKTFGKTIDYVHHS